MPAGYLQPQHTVHHQYAMERRKPQLTFQDVCSSLDKLKPQLECSPYLELKEVPEPNLEQKMMQIQREKLKRDRMGPFLGQVIKNVSCLFSEDSTQESTASTAASSSKKR
jgi:hypothetical protein